MSVIGKLHFNSVSFIRLEDGVHPHLICPTCKRDWIPNLSLGTSFPTTFDFNKLVGFTAPAHTNPATGVACPIGGRRFEWFVAVHRDADGLRVCIQKSIEEGAGGIPAKWWVKI